MPKKMPNRLVALSASAVATIYAAGLLSTHAAAQSVAAVSTATDSTAAPAASASLTSTAAPTSAPAVVVGASASATPAATTAPTATATLAAPTTTSTTVTAASSATYADGTYSGTGTSRFGNVSVAVTVASDKITNVQITRVTTSFPVSRIASLPAQVIKGQTANVNVVTGATYSSQAFKQAVQQALAQSSAAVG
jgi:uncharacterized protein with FMN-binding domain